MKIFFVFILPVFLLLICNAEAATVTASSCSQSAVQSAVTTASTGDTVLIPAGSCQWSNSITLNKKLTIQGAGYDKTVITVTGTAINTGGTSSRVTGIGFNLGGPSSSGIVEASGKNWRIDHCKFTNNVTDRSYGVLAQANSASSNPAGLIDNCVFVNARVLVNGVLNFNEQHKIWAQDANLGGPDAVYIEDCETTKTFMGNVVDASRGGKYVFRFNTVTNGDIQAHSVQSASNRGTRSWEIYNNTLVGTSVNFFRRPIFLRAGEGMLFNNNITGKWSTSVLHLDSRRAYDALPNLCDGTSYLDNNEPGQNGALCRDQPGAGKDTRVGYDKKFYEQTRSPVYAWGNTYPVAPNATSGIHLKANRDYYDGSTWGLQTSPTSPFNGTSGVGRGVFANMPTTCTAGVGYWAIDKGGNWNKANSESNDGALYRCMSTNVWTPIAYVPYEYPHPLRSGETPPPPDTGDIKPPGNFRIAK